MLYYLGLLQIVKIINESFSNPSYILPIRYFFV